MKNGIHVYLGEDDDRSVVSFHFTDLRFYLAFLRPSRRVAFPQLDLDCLWPSRRRSNKDRLPRPRRETLGRGYSALQQESCSVIVTGQRE